MRIEPLTPEHAGAWLEFFDSRAFCDNPNWKYCYCTFYHKSGEPVQVREENPGDTGAGAGPGTGTAAGSGTRRPTNRDLAKKLIETGTMKGYLAFGDGGNVIGWCNVNGRSAYPRLGFEDDGTKVKAVVCFIIDPDHRRRGVASALLERAITDATAEGFEWIEAYPKTRARSDSGNYHGPLSLYRKLGFGEIPEGRVTIVRKRLGTP